MTAAVVIQKMYRGYRWRLRYFSRFTRSYIKAKRRWHNFFTTYRMLFRLRRHKRLISQVPASFRRRIPYDHYCRHKKLLRKQANEREYDRLIKFAVTKTLDALCAEAERRQVVGHRLTVWAISMFYNMKLRKCGELW